MSDIEPIGWISDDCSALLEAKREGRGFIYPDTSPDHDNAVYLDVDVNQQRGEVERLRAEVEHGRNARAAMADRLFGALRALGNALGVLKCINDTAEACPICGGTRPMVDCGESADGWSTRARIGPIRHSETCTLNAAK